LQSPLAESPFLWHVEHTGPLAQTTATTRSSSPQPLHVARRRVQAPHLGAPAWLPTTAYIGEIRSSRISGRMPACMPACGVPLLP
jgi:hypothetical protein